MTIQLDEKWRIESDAYSWKLIFSEERMKDEYEKVGKKLVKTGNEVPFMFVDEWWFPTIQQCLKEYIKHVFKTTPTIEDMVSKLDTIDAKISEVKGIFIKQ